MKEQMNETAEEKAKGLVMKMKKDKIVHIRKAQVSIDLFQ
jgi:hypothetical protein